MMRIVICTVFLSLLVSILPNGLYAQTQPDKPNPIENQRVKKDPPIKPKTDREREVEESIERAAEAAANAAEKLRVVIEDKADRIARSSKPYIENFLIATSNLIEKLSIEIEKAVDDRPVKKGKETKD